MATARKWSNVAVAMQSALGTQNTITAITKASPGVVTYSGSDPSNGDYILLTVQGMYQLNARVFRVANVNAGGNTLELEGENTTNYDTFTSGYFEPITFGTTVSTLTNLSSSGGDLNFLRTTTIHTNQETQLPGTTNPITYNFDSIWDASDTGLAALKTAYQAGSARCFKFTFGTGGPIMVFNGYVGASLAPVGSAGELVTTPVAITQFGAPTYYAS